MVMLHIKFKCFPAFPVLALLIFILYINVIGENITPHIKLFADDCQLFRTIDSVADTVDSVADTVDSVADTVDSVADTVDSVADTVDSVADTVDRFADTVDSVADTVDSVADTVNSFADTVDSVADTDVLQNDLCKMSLWTRKWQIIFNPEKYYTLQIYTTQNPLKMDYVEGVTLEPVSHHPYLGVEVQQDLKRKSHINNITSKANKTLGLTKRSLHKCSQEVKAEAYTTLVRPKLEYSSAICDSYRKYQINQMEKIQYRAAVLY